MKASEGKLLDFLRKPVRLEIPVFQRQYTWSKKECGRLWDDILRVGRREEAKTHFIGSVLYVTGSALSSTGLPSAQVIDGHQRLTTVTLLLEALARHVEDSEPVPGFSARNIRDYYLLDPLEKGMDRYKLVLSRSDKESLIRLLRQDDLSSPLPPDRSSQVDENFDFFTNQIRRLGGDLAALCNGLNRLIIVDISLNRAQDNPQRIFESLNATGVALASVDLARNYTLMGLAPAVQQDLYDRFWCKMERGFSIFKEGASSAFDEFLRHYVRLRTDRPTTFPQLSDEFKRYVQRLMDKGKSMEDVLRDVHAMANHYLAVRNADVHDVQLKEALEDLRVLDYYGVTVQLLLPLREYRAQGLIQTQELVRAVRLLESYVFRRTVCGWPPNSLMYTFTLARRKLDKDRCVQSLQGFLVAQNGLRVFPDDDVFTKCLVERDLFKFEHWRYLFRRMENRNRKEPINVDEYSVEHIMPQQLPQAWKRDLGPEWRRIYRDYRHTLGNLTLTGYNSEYSNRPFKEKRDMVGGFHESPLRLNQGLGQLEKWDEPAIGERAARLAEWALDIWPRP